MELIISDPKLLVSFTKQQRPRAASQAAKVRRVRIKNKEFINIANDRIIIKIVASKNISTIKKWDR
jgi:hypothetical protein